MAFPSATPLATALQGVLAETASIKLFCTNRIATLAAGSQSADYILDIHTKMLKADAALAAAAATPGLAAYASEQFDNVDLDIAAEFTALRAAIQAVRDHVETAVPKDGSGYWLLHQFVNHVVTPRMFAPAATATLRTLLTTVSNAIA